MMGPTDGNPFAVLALVGAPAVLTNAMSVLALGSGNRVARVQDRFRETLREFEAAAVGSAEREARRRQLGRLQERARLLLKSMRCFFMALGAFAATTVLAVVGAGLQAIEDDWGLLVTALVALAVGLFAVANLLVGCVLLVRDTRLAVEGIEERAAELPPQEGPPKA